MKTRRLSWAIWMTSKKSHELLKAEHSVTKEVCVVAVRELARIRCMWPAAMRQGQTKSHYKKCDLLEIWPYSNWQMIWNKRPHSYKYQEKVHSSPCGWPSTISSAFWRDHFFANNWIPGLSREKTVPCLMWMSDQQTVRK